ncbi:MAG: hypothetical protein IJ167_00525 [Lachnospiraceae bacterium]|nr:hypothetical protein [Lachnospiraceae bacterium]
MGASGMGQVTVKYYRNPECTAELVGSPTNVGTYYVGITAEESENYNAVSTVLHDVSWQFTINRAMPSTGSFTYEAPSNLTYDGNAKTATVESTQTGMGQVTVKYYSDKECTTEVTPTNVGTYYVGITVAEGDNYSAVSTVLHDASWQFSINRAMPSTGSFTYEAPSNLTYDGNAKAATVVGASGMGAVTVKYYSDEECTTEVTPTNVGTYYVGIEVAEGENYSGVSTVLCDATWTFTISKQAAPVSLNADQKPTAKTGLTYTGNELELVTAPTNVPAGYTVQYSLDGTNWSADLPKGTNTGSYTVKVKYVGDANHSDFNGTDISVTIGKAAAPTLTDNQKPTAKTGLTYTGSDQTLVTAPIEIPVGYTGIQYALGTATEAKQPYITSIPTATDAGTYYVWYMVEGDENHEDISAECITVTISHKLTKHEAVEPTATKDGNITYWTCDGCGKFFSDEDGKTEIKEADTIIPATGETPEEPTPKGELSKVGIYCSQDNPSVIAAFLTKKSIETDTIEYRWVACESDNPNSWFIVSDWTKDNFYLSWTPEKDGDYVIVAQARLVGNEEETMVSDSFGVNYRTVKPKIKDICQIPVEDGYLIGIESTENPNQSLTYEMLILDLSLLADGNPDCWIYGVKGQTSEGNALWTIWKPQYGYYITLFRIYDENGNQLDQTAYGFVNAY